MSNDLRQQIQQKRAFDSPEQEAFLNLVRTTAGLTDALDAVLKEAAGITAAQFNVLRILRGAEPDGLCRNQVRDRMLTRMPDMTRLLDRMEESGLVVRERDADDRRMVRTRITAAAQRLLAQVDGRVHDMHKRQLGHLSREQLETLIELLTAARNGRK